jgi:ribulose 1,5-bisphosphate carboxylase large subunit-like protein
MTDSLTKHFLATYYIESKQDLRQVAETIADIESTGQWLGTGKPTELYLECRAEVGAIREQAPGRGEIDILFPLINLNLEEAAFPGLWLTMIGGGTHALIAYEITVNGF